MASALLRIAIPPPVLRLDTTLQSGATLLASGGWWGTDRCDQRVAIVLRPGRGAERVLARVDPGAAGGFSQTLTLPANLPAGSSLVGRQSRGREIADARGRPGKGRCIRSQRATKIDRTKAVLKVPVATEPPPVPPVPVPPTPTPTPTPEPTPTPTPTPTPPAPPTLEAVLDGSDGLTITGAGWAPGECAGTANPITLTLAHAGKPAAALGVATPDAKGAFLQAFKPVIASTGDEVTASQTACDGSSLSQKATVP